MPRNVRNWWIEARIDGRTTRIACGPQSKIGGIEIRILQRNAGNIIEAVDVWGVAEDNGRLSLHARYGKDVKDAMKNKTVGEVCADELTVRTVR
jgi:hypothetical protein